MNELNCSLRSKVNALIVIAFITLMFGCQKYRDDTSSTTTVRRSVTSTSSGTLIADAYVQDGSYANSNYGSSGWLIAKNDAVGYKREIYLKFDISSLPLSGATIQSSRIQLTGGVSSASDTANAKWVYYATSDKSWTETAITFNNAPGTGSLLGEVNGTLKTTGSTVYFDIPASIIESAWSSDKKISIRIVAQPRGSSSSGIFYSDFYSKEASDTSYRPKLQISYSQASDYYLNLLMDEITYDSIRLDLQNSEQARSFIGTAVTAKADQALSQTPSPVAQISSGTVEAGVNAEADRIYSLGLQYFLFQTDPLAQSYADKVKEYLLAWAAVNTPSTETPQESAYLGFMYGYSLVRNKIDSSSRATIDNWFRNRYNFYKGRPVRNDNWESIRVALMLSIAYMLNDATFISQSTTAFNTHQNLSYRADGCSVDFVRRDAFAYHVYDMSFVGRSLRILYIYNGRTAANNLAYHRATSWITPRLSNPGPAVLGGSFADAIAFMKPYVVDPANNVHLEYVNTEWAPDKQKSDYNKPFNPGASVYGLIEAASVLKDEVNSIFLVLDPTHNRYKKGIKFYINSFSVSATDPNPAKAILYGNTNYIGWYKELGVGQYTLADLTAAGVLNDQLSSLIIPAGFKVTLYEHGGFNGSSIILTGNTINLIPLNFNDKMSSIKIELL